MSHLEPFDKGSRVKSVTSCAAPTSLWVLAFHFAKDDDGDDVLCASFSRALGINTYLFENGTTSSAVLFLDPVTQKLHDSSETAEGVLCYYLCDEKDYGPLYPSAKPYTVPDSRPRAVKINDMNQFDPTASIDSLQPMDKGHNYICVRDVYKRHAHQLPPSVQ